MILPLLTSMVSTWVSSCAPAMADCSLNPLCFRYHRAFDTLSAPPPSVDSVFHFLPTCLTFYSTFKTQLQDSPLISGLPQHPLYYRPDSSWSHLCPFSMAAFHLHVLLLQQTVRSLREATHVALTSTLPPTSEFAIWMDPTFWKAANFPSSLKTFLHGLCGAAYKSENVCQDGSKNRRSHALSIWRGQLKSPPTNF